MKTLLRWAGSKTKLLKDIIPIIPPHNNYYEPFLGTGQVYLNKPKSLTAGVATLSDSCYPLMCFHTSILMNPCQFIELLKGHKNGKDYYNSVRATLRGKGYADNTLLIKASNFYYLMQTCFNGLYRVNKDGYFNVPFGKRDFVFSTDAILKHHAQLEGSTLYACDFRAVPRHARAGDFVYLDPPYVPTGDGCFVNYSKNGFSLEDCESLAETCQAFDKRGVKFLMSNSDSPLVRQLWGDYNIKTVETYRSISAKPSARKIVPELLVSNY